MESGGIPQSIIRLSAEMEVYSTEERHKITPENSISVLISGGGRKSTCQGYFIKSAQLVVRKHELKKCHYCTGLFADPLKRFGIHSSSGRSKSICPECVRMVITVLTQSRFEGETQSRFEEVLAAAIPTPFDSSATEDEEEEAEAAEDEEAKDNKRKRVM